MLRLRNRIAGIFITVVGGIFLIVAVFMFVSSGWTTTTATAGGCVPSGQTGATTTSRVYHDYCQMNDLGRGGRAAHWDARHGRTNIHPGTTFTVKVSGDSIAMPSAVVVPAGHPRRRGGRRRRGLTLALRRPRSRALTSTPPVP